MYFLIGICLLFAYLYSINLLGSLFAATAWSGLARWASGLRPSTRTDLLFVLRIGPIALALATLAVFMLPSFLLYEPEQSDEIISYKMVLIVAISAIGIVLAIGRVFLSWWRTRRLLDEWMRNSTPLERDDLPYSAYTIEHPFPIIAVVGSLTPKIFVADQVLSELDESEFAAALAHEVAHVAKSDNLRRLLMRLCSDLLILPLGKQMDQRWTDSAELAADESSACRGDGRSALDLASALVKIGRMAPTDRSFAMPSAAYLVDPTEGPLTSRIERLINISSDSHAVVTLSSRRLSINILTAVFVGILMSIPFLVKSDFLFSVHQFTETIFSSLQ